MFNIFLDRFAPKVGGLNHPASMQVKRRYDYIKQVMTDYYARSGVRPENEHILVQILRSLSFSLNSPIEEIWGSVYARSPYVAKHYGLTSPISFGRTHYKQFYGRDKSFKEFLFDTELMEVDPYVPMKSWRNLSPIRVLYHPAVDFHFLLTDGRSMPYRDNFSVVAIDVALLVFQYHQYKREQWARFGQDAILTPGAFLTREVFPKMYDSHVDLAVLNNFFYPGGFAEKSELMSIPWPPITFPDMTDNVKAVTTDLNRRVKKLPVNYRTTLQNLPVPVAGRADIALQLPRVPMTKQGSWVLWLSRFRYMFELIRLSGDKGIKENKQFISELKVNLGLFVNDGNYRNFDDKDLEEEFLYFADYVKNL